MFIAALFIIAEIESSLEVQQQMNGLGKCDALLSITQCFLLRIAMSSKWEGAEMNEQGPIACELVGTALWEHS